MANYVVGLLFLIGFACQLIGIRKAISEFPKVGKWFERRSSDHVIAPGTSALNLEGLKARGSGGGAPPPNATLEQLTVWADTNIACLRDQITSAYDELEKVDRARTLDIKNEQSKRNDENEVIRKGIAETTKTANSSGLLVLVGTFLLAVSEVIRWSMHV